jgi:hypothetical protein
MLDKIARVSGISCISCISIGIIPFFIWLIVQGTNKMQCNEPVYECKQIYTNDLRTCTILLESPNRNITCPCPQKSGYGNFECYIPVDDSTTCFTRFCEEANPDFKEGLAMEVVGVLLGAIYAIVVAFTFSWVFLSKCKCSHCKGKCSDLCDGDCDFDLD